MRPLLSCFAALVLAAPAFADPLTPATLPADTLWVMHVDVDAAAKTPLWELARTRIVQPQRDLLLPRLEVLQRLTGMKFPQDLHDVTLYGSTYQENAACILIHGTLDRDALLAALKANRDFRSDDHNGHAILTWHDAQRDRLMYGAFAGKDIAILGPSPQIVARALDTLDAKSPALKSDSPLIPPTRSPQNAAGVRPPAKAPFFWIAGTTLSELARLKKTESPLLGQMDAAAVAAIWSDDTLTTRFTVVAKSDKAAQQMLHLADGFKALIDLAASDEHATASSKAASDALQHLSFTAQDRQVTGEWALPADKMEALLDSAKQELAHSVSTPVAAPPPAPDKNH